jgi:hypothetical protein
MAVEDAGSVEPSLSAIMPQKHKKLRRDRVLECQRFETVRTLNDYLLSGIGRLIGGIFCTGRESSVTFCHPSTTRKARMPARAIRPSYRSHITGRQSFIPGGNSIAHESTLERDFVTLCRFDPGVLAIEEQPVTINWIDPLGGEVHFMSSFIAKQLDTRGLRSSPITDSRCSGHNGKGIDSSIVVGLRGR